MLAELLQLAPVGVTYSSVVKSSGDSTKSQGFSGTRVDKVRFANEIRQQQLDNSLKLFDWQNTRKAGISQGRCDDDLDAQKSSEILQVEEKTRKEANNSARDSAATAAVSTIWVLARGSLYQVL